MSRTRRRAADVAALAAGCVLPLGFAPFGFWPALPASLAVLLALWRDGGAGRAAWRGWLFGLGSFGVGASWVRESFRFSDVEGLLALVLAAGFVAFLALYPALAGALAALLGGRARRGAGRLLAGAGAWIGVEWLRGQALSGFTWLQAGYSQVDGPLAGAFPLVGVYGVGLVLAASAAVLAAPGAWRRTWPAALGLAALWVAAGAAARVEWSRADGAPLEVAALQGNFAQDQKWRPEMREPTLARYLELWRRHRDADLVVWPETALPAYYHELRGFIGSLAAEAAANGATVLAGVPVLDARRRAVYNSVVALGGEPGFYHKRHLVPFGEYLPFAPLLGPVVRALGVAVASFTPGPADQPPLRVGGVPLAIFICYEVSFGEEVRARLPAARLLVTVSNDAWFGASLGPHQHLEIARARALETRRWLVRATNTGITAIVDPFGRVVARAPQFEVASVRARVAPRAGATPYVRAGDAPALGLALALAAAGAVAGRGARPSADQARR